MKLCIVSDSHDRADALAQAVQAAHAEGAECAIHCGDLIGANTLRAAMRVGLPLHVIHGNNLGDPQALHKLCAEQAGLVHYPEYGHAMACTGDWDLVCCGHDHRASVRRVPNVKGSESWLVNPGTVAGLAAPATWMLADLAAMHFEIRATP